jgi:cold shock CspA family protein
MSDIHNSNTSNIFNKSSASLDSKRNIPSDRPIGLWGGHNVRSVDGQSHVKTSESLSDTANKLEVQNVKTEKKSIASKIRNAISNKISSKKLFLLTSTIIGGIIAMCALGPGAMGIPIAAGVGAAIIGFIIISVTKGIKDGYANKESAENKEDKKLQEDQEVKEQSSKSKSGSVKEQEPALEATTKNDEINQDIQDPSKLSKWQKIKNKFKKSDDKKLSISEEIEEIQQVIDQLKAQQDRLVAEQETASEATINNDETSQDNKIQNDSKPSKLQKLKQKFKRKTSKKHDVSKETQELQETTEQLKESNDSLVEGQEVASKTTIKNDAIDKDNKDIQDPSKLSRWQKIKKKLRTAAPFILGVTLIALSIALAVTATVFSGGATAVVGPALLPLIATSSSVGTLMGFLCIGKGVTRALDNMDEQKAFLDKQNNNIDKELSDANTMKRLNNTKTTQEKNQAYDPKKFV